MKRKLIGQGAGGITVTLPINWVREFSLQAGTEVDLSQTDQGILISAAKIKTPKTLTLDLREYDSRMILNFLNQAYRLGYDTLQIQYATPSQYTAIAQITRNTLLGFEIVEHKPSHITLQNIAEPDAEKFDIILRKIFLQILELASHVTDAFKNPLLNQSLIEEYKIQIDKLTNYSRRTIIKTSSGGDKSVLLYSILSQLSLVSHAYYYMYTYSLSKKKKLSPELLFTLTGINHMFREYYEAFYSQDIKRLARISQFKDEFTKQNLELFEKSTPNTVIFLAHMREIIRSIHMCLPFSVGYWLGEGEKK